MDVDNSVIVWPDVLDLQPFKKFGYQDYSSQIVTITGTNTSPPGQYNLPANPTLANACIKGITVYAFEDQENWTIDGQVYEVLRESALAYFTMTLLSINDDNVLLDFPSNVLNSSFGNRRGNEIPMNFRFTPGSSYLQMMPTPVLPANWCIPVQFYYDPL